MKVRDYTVVIDNGDQKGSFSRDRVEPAPITWVYWRKKGPREILTPMMEKCETSGDYINDMPNNYSTLASIMTRINSSIIPDGSSLSNGLLDLPLVGATGAAINNAEKDSTKGQDYNMEVTPQLEDITPAKDQNG